MKIEKKTFFELSSFAFRFNQFDGGIVFHIPKSLVHQIYSCPMKTQHPSDALV